VFIITNRNVHENKTDLDAFGSKPSEKGPNELRLAEAKRVGGKWKVAILPDVIKTADAKAAGLTQRTDDDGNPIPFYASQLVSCS
jgi:hypothetical protein